jgi:hypothetical protein
MANAFDEFDTQPTGNAFDEFAATVNAPKTATDILTYPKTPWERFTSPTTPEPVSGKDILMGVGVGTGLGAAIGSPTLLGAPVAATVGGVTGGLSTLAGEVARAQGASPAAQLTAETIAGLGLNLVGMGAKSAAKQLLPWRERAIARMLPGKSEEAAVQKVGQRMFGKDTYNAMYTTENSQATQQALKEQIFGKEAVALGQIDETTKASSLLRDRFYKNLDKLQDSKVAFRTSPEFKTLEDDLMGLLERPGMLDKKEISIIKKITGNTFSARPDVKEKASQDLLNLIQNGGLRPSKEFGKQEVLIGKEAQDLLKKRFDEYLMRNVGEKQYSVLKQAERQEFIAEARDAIPALFAENAKVVRGSPEWKAVLESVANSPEGKKDLIGAFNRTIAGMDDLKKIEKVYYDVIPALRASGAVDMKQSAEILAKIKAIPKEASKELQLSNIKKALLFPSIGTTAANIGSDQVQANLLGALAPFSM